MDSLSGRRDHLSQQYQERMVEDEINLVDLWLVLLRHKKVIFITFSITLLIGVAIVTLRPALYSYTTTIEIGSIKNSDGESQFIATPETLLAKLEESYIPVLLQQLDESESDITIEARIPKESQLVIMESSGPKKEEKIHLRLQQQIAEKVIADYQPQISVERKNIEVALTKQRIELEALRDPIILALKRQKLKDRLQRARWELEIVEEPLTLEIPKKELEQKIELAKKGLLSLQENKLLLQQRYSRIATEQKLITSELTTLKTQTNRAVERSIAAEKEATNEAKAMTLMLIENSTQQNRLRQATLEQRLYIGLPEQETVLEHKIIDNLRLQESQQSKIELITNKLQRLITNHQRTHQQKKLPIRELELELEKFEGVQQRAVAQKEAQIERLQNTLTAIQETRTVTPPINSGETGTDLKIVLALTAILGLILALFSAFFAEFFRHVKDRLSMAERDLDQHKELGQEVNPPIRLPTTKVS